MAAQAHPGSSRILRGPGSFAEGRGCPSGCGAGSGSWKDGPALQRKAWVREILERRAEEARALGHGGRLRSALLLHLLPHVLLLFGPQSHPTLFNLLDGQHARLPCPPLSPRLCPDSCP